MDKPTRQDLKTRYELFEKFALGDQRKYYRNTLRKYRSSARQVNRFRAMFALFTGIFSALAGLVVQYNFVENARCTVENAPGNCDTIQNIVYLLMFLSVVMPVLGGVFNTLADLYQWDRMITIYEAALENLKVADALSPMDEMTDEIYQASLMAYSEGTLSVMNDETAQWGQAIRTPESLEEFIKRQTGGSNNP